MFGLIISGRPVDAQPQAITDTQYAFRIPPTPAFSHIVVFVLPGIQLPEGTAATVYVQMPPSQEFRLLGAVGPGKESAIFKVSGVQRGNGNNSIDTDVMTDDNAGDARDIPQDNIAVGISIEPALQVDQQLAAMKQSLAAKASPQEPSTSMVRRNATVGEGATTKLLAQRIIGNAFNFLASFGSDTVPLKAFQDWWTKFEKKIELDPSFLERENQG